MNYLIDYLPKTYDREESATSKETLSKAIESFQQSNRIPVSGLIDDQTCKRMKQPKCGGMIPPDSFHSTNNRTRRYASFELRWPRKNLTWK